MCKDNSIRLGDFGLSDNIKRIRTQKVGTKAYMAPEQFEIDDINSLDDKKATDMWCIGCVLYELCTGKLLVRLDFILGERIAKKSKMTSTSLLTPHAHSNNSDEIDFIMPRLPPARYSIKKNAEVEAYAAITHEGLVRHYNEDRVSIILNLMKPANKHVMNWPKMCFFGVYDGHGGSNCADYLRDHLHHYVTYN